MTRPAKRKVRAVEAWAGIVDGRIHGYRSNEDTPHYVSVYRDRRSARMHYECVIRVRITPIRARVGGRGK